jgi:hypothetical protein
VRRHPRWCWCRHCSSATCGCGSAAHACSSVHLHIFLGVHVGQQWMFRFNHTQLRGVVSVADSVLHLVLQTRMAHSSYDYMFGKPAMRFLMNDYLQVVSTGCKCVHCMSSMLEPIRYNLPWAPPGHAGVAELPPCRGSACERRGGARRA